MSVQAVLILMLVGISAGMLGGLVGVGGGIIIVPSLIYFLGFSQRMAAGTSLGILLLPIGILGVLQFYKAGYVDVKAACLVSLGFLAGSYFGSKIALHLPQETIKRIFAALLIMVAVKMLFFDKPEKDKIDNSSALHAY